MIFSLSFFSLNEEREKNIKKKAQLIFLLSNNNYNYMINDEREKNDKEKITIKFLCLILIFIIYMI